MQHNNPRRIVLVHWKKLAENTIEVFSSLKNFCDSHNDYNYNTLNNYLSKRKKAYETNEIRIERKPVMTKAIKPDLPASLFWEFDYEHFDWMRSYRTVIERVIERGNPEQWEVMLNFYSREKVIYALKEEIPYLTDRGINSACQFFQLRETELRCNEKKQLQKTQWI